MASEKKFKIYANQTDGPGSHVFFINSIPTIQRVQEAIRARLGPIRIKRMYYKCLSNRFFLVNSYLLSHLYAFNTKFQYSFFAAPALPLPHSDNIVNDLGFIHMDNWNTKTIRVVYTMNGQQHN